MDKTATCRIARKGQLHSDVRTDFCNKQNAAKALNFHPNIAAEENFATLGS